MLEGVDALTRRLRGVPRNPQHLRTGLRGEEEALYHLRRMGYTIVARRWVSPKVPGDIDLIGWQGEWLCFIEVKSRTGQDRVPAEFAVDGPKQEMLRRMAQAYVKRFPEEQRRRIPVRFDVVSVYFTGHAAVEIEVFAGAFPRRKSL